jgi:hypothetical protein
VILRLLKRRHRADGRRKNINPRLLELQVALEILAEIFQARPADIENMIQGRIGESGWAVDQAHSPDEGLWPATFRLGD